MATTFHWFSHVSSSRISLVITSWRAEKQEQQQQASGVKPNSIKEVCAVIITTLLQGGNEMVIFVVLTVSCQHRANAILQMETCTVCSDLALDSRCSCRDKSIKCSIMVQVCTWHFMVQSMVKWSSFIEYCLLLISVPTCKYVVLSLPWLKCSSQALGITPSQWLFLGVKSGHPVIWGETKTERNLQGFKCTLAVLKERRNLSCTVRLEKCH